MPFLGKSGTDRICALRSMRVVCVTSGGAGDEVAPGLPGRDREIVMRAARVLVVDDHARDAGATRPRSDGPLDVGHGGLLAFDQRFDAAVRDVAHPAGGPLALRRLLHEPAEADALYAAANEKAPCYTHRYI